MTRSVRSEPRKRVLVIYKKSTYQIYVRERGNERVRGLIERGERVVERLLPAHEQHMRTMELAKSVLSDLGVRAVFRYRSDAGSADSYDLVVTLGGDGTFLWASHMVGSVPMVGINTAPGDSVGFFCAGSTHDLHDVLAGALGGRLPSTRLTRMAVSIDGELASNRVLNDVLFCHSSPAAVSRYDIHVGDAREEHRSSGVWVGPAAGSTAAQRSAGGRVMPVGSRRLQYVVREPYRALGAELQLVKGFIGPQEHLRLVSRIRSGQLFIDGPRIWHPVDIGTEVTMETSSEPLDVLGFSR